MRAMGTTKRAIPEEQKKREGEMLRAAFAKAKAREPGLTQESLIYEMGLKSQGQFGQWCDGKTPIPDKRVLWLATRLGFDAAEMRPSLQGDYRITPGASPPPPHAHAHDLSLDDLLSRIPEREKQRALATLFDKLPPKDIIRALRALLDRLEDATSDGPA